MSGSKISWRLPHSKLGFVFCAVHNLEVVVNSDSYFVVYTVESRLDYCAFTCNSSFCFRNQAQVFCWWWLSDFYRLVREFCKLVVEQSVFMLDLVKRFED